ncbi:MAG: hypothetical protein K9I85_07670 [Saprospiraceae bacterium]|nr:hypothetical protein [Saprospiraceae bacterium]
MRISFLSLVSYLITIMFVGFACENTMAPAQDAQRICACLQPIDSLNQQLVITLDHGTQEEAMEIMMDLNQMSQHVADCLDACLPSDLSAWPENGLKAELDRQCPQWEAMLHSLLGYDD